MPQRISKNSKRKFGFNPGYLPKFFPDPTEAATFPVWQQDGIIKYVDLKDLVWITQNRHDFTIGSAVANPKSHR